MASPQVCIILVDAGLRASAVRSLRVDPEAMLVEAAWLGA
jgi:hypothetical protein